MAVADVPAPGRMSAPLRHGGQALVPIAAALVVGAAVLAATGWDPLSVYRLMASEAFGSWDRIESTLGAATPLLFTGLATAIAFRGGVFNIGVEGSFVLGGLAAAWLGAELTGLPGWLLIPVGMVAGALAGGAWSVPPAILRARLGVDEVVTTLMLNFVALSLASWIVNTVLLAEGTANSASPLIARQAELPAIGGRTLTIALPLALVGDRAVRASGSAAASSGFELRMTGLNPAFARTAGVSVRRVIVIAMTVVGPDRRPRRRRPRARRRAPLRRRLLPRLRVHRHRDRAARPQQRHRASCSPPILFGALSSAGATVQLFSDIPLDIVDVLQGTIMIFAAVQVVDMRRRLRRGAA